MDDWDFAEQPKETPDSITEEHVQVARLTLVDPKGNEDVIFEGPEEDINPALRQIFDEADEAQEENDWASIELLLDDDTQDPIEGELLEIDSIAFNDILTPETIESFVEGATQFSTVLKTASTGLSAMARAMDDAATGARRLVFAHMWSEYLIWKREHPRESRQFTPYDVIRGLV